MDGVIYLNKCPVCVADPIDWFSKKPLPDTHTRYGVVTDPGDAKYLCEYFKAKTRNDRYLNDMDFGEYNSKNIYREDKI